MRTDETGAADDADIATCNDSFLHRPKHYIAALSALPDASARRLFQYSTHGGNLTCALFRFIILVVFNLALCTATSEMWRYRHVSALHTGRPRTRRPRRTALAGQAQTRPPQGAPVAPPPPFPDRRCF